MKKIFFAFAIIATLCGVASCNNSTENKEDATEVVGCAAETDSIATDTCAVEVTEVVAEETAAE